jgi:hypothetical protein
MDNPNIGIDEELILIYDAPNQTTAELVCATLQAAGLRAVLQHEYGSPASGWMNHIWTNRGKGVGVPASEVEAAQAILADQEISEEELLNEMEMDGMTLEEAEARVK